MTATDQRLRRSALAVLAVGVALGASACSAGQISQTATQVPAVDGGSAQTQDLSVNDVRVVLTDGGQAELAFTASYFGTSLGTAEGIALERVVVDGKTARLGQVQPLKRGCTLVASPSDSVSTDPVDGVCIAYAEASLPEADGFDNGRSVRAEFTFSNGETLTANAGVVDEHETAGKYSRPSETVVGDAGH